MKKPTRPLAFLALVFLLLGLAALANFVFRQNLSADAFRWSAAAAPAATVQNDVDHARIEQLEKELSVRRAVEAERAHTLDMERLAIEEHAKKEQVDQENAALREHAQALESRAREEQHAKRVKAEPDLAPQLPHAESLQIPLERERPITVPGPAFPSPERRRPRVAVTNIVTQHNVDVSGQTGMAIHVQVSAEGFSGQRLYVAAYFFFGSGAPLADTDGAFRSRNGQVSTGRTLLLQAPRETDMVTLEIPYSELHVPPKVHSELEYRIVVFDRDAVEGQAALYNSGPRPFALN